MQNIEKSIMYKMVRGAALILLLHLLTSCGNKTLETEEVTVVESVEESTPAEEEVIEEVEEEKEAAGEGKKINAFDAQLFYESQNEPSPIVSTEYWEESEAESTEVKEPEIEIIESAESVPADEEPAASTENSNNIVYSEPVGTGNSSSIDFTSSSNLQTVKADADAKIHAECGGGNENTGFIIESDTTYITYHGKQDFVQCSVSVVGDKVSVSVNTNLNDVAWGCIGATLSEIFPNGYTLASAMRNDCESGTGGYGNENEWVSIDGVSSTVKTMSENEVGAPAYGSIIYIFQR